MKDFMLKTIINLVNPFYEKIFHEKISDEVKIFLQSLSFVAAGFISVGVFTIIFNILAGRILGPSEYGEFTLVQTIAMFLYIPMILGYNTAMIKYCSQEENISIKSKIISISYLLVFLFTISIALLYFVFTNQLSELFSVSEDLICLSIPFAILFTFYLMAQGALRGLLKMKILSILSIIYSIILLFSFVFFIIVNIVSFRFALYSYYLAYGVTGSIVLLILNKYKYLKLKLDKFWINKLSYYSFFALIGSLSFVFYTNIDKLLIKSFMTIADVGIYRAYFYASINVVGFMSTIFFTVFFPIASKFKNKKYLFKMTNKFVPYLIVFGLPLILLLEFIILLFFGKDYPLDLLLISLFAITSILVFWYGTYAWIFNSEGIKGVKLSIVSSSLIAIVNIILNILFIPSFGLYGAIGSTLVSYCSGLSILTIWRGRIS